MTIKTDPHDWWRNALANPKLIGTPTLPIHENEPQPGRYKTKARDGKGWDPVAIWIDDDGRLKALRGEIKTDPYEIWTHCATRPIKAAIYASVMAGNPWPDGIDHIEDEEGKVLQAAKTAAAIASGPETIQQVVAAAEKHFGPGVEVTQTETIDQPSYAPVYTGIGHNSGLPEEVALDELKSVERRIKAWIDQIGAVDSEEKDAQGEQFKKLVADVAKTIEDGFRAEKDPLVKAGKAVDDKWRLVRERADTVKKRLSDILTAYRVERDRKRREEAKKAREAAAQVADGPVPSEPLREAPKGFRTVQVVVVTDAATAAQSILQQVPDQPDLLDAIRKAAKRMISAGVPVVGVEVRDEHRA